jgi:hypothetical protein
MLGLVACQCASQCSCAINLVGRAMLPAPLEFTTQLLGDREMMVASTVLSSEETKHFFLEADTFKQLEDFVVERPNRAPQMLVLTGPVKSGKSFILNDVLPGLISARHATATKPKAPAIFRFAFDPTEPPHVATRSIVTAANNFAKLFGFAIPMPPSDAKWTFHYLDTSMGALASELYDRGWCLWLLLDECQVRSHGIGLTSQHRHSAQCILCRHPS